jgi:hypothetical protein
MYAAVSLLSGINGCSAEIPPAANKPIAFETILIRIGQRERTWREKDSLAWHHSRDSIATAMKRVGGKAFSCEHAPTTPVVRELYYWWFPRFVVRLSAHPLSPRREWELRLDSLSIDIPC